MQWQRAPGAAAKRTRTHQGIPKGKGYCGEHGDKATRSSAAYGQGELQAKPHDVPSRLRPCQTETLSGMCGCGWVASGCSANAPSPQKVLVSVIILPDIVFDVGPQRHGPGVP